MRYPASEKLEILRTVEASHLPTKQTLAMIGIPSSTYYDWYARWVEGGFDALADRPPRPRSVWNRIPDKIRGDVVDFALEHEDLTPRELAVKYTDEKRYFVSESSVYRILSAEDLITAPAHVVIRAADEFRDKTTRPNELWQTDFTYLKVIGWGWFYLSTILDDYSRYIIAWKLCTTMKAADVTDTLELALDASGYPFPHLMRRPWNGRFMASRPIPVIRAKAPFRGGTATRQTRRPDGCRGRPHPHRPRGYRLPQAEGARSRTLSPRPG